MPKRTIRLSPKLPKRKSVVTEPRRILKVKRNEPCPCESGKKYKDCHASKGEAFLRKIARKKEKEQLREARSRSKPETVPWYRRLLGRS